MTPSELRDLLFKYDEGRLKGPSVTELHNFGIWWWNDFLNDQSRALYKKSATTSMWEDLRRLTDKELMLAWACFKM